MIGCQYVSISVSRYQYAQSSSDSVTHCFCLHPSCLKIFGLCLIIQSQSLHTSAFWLKPSVMFASVFILLGKVCQIWEKGWLKIYLHYPFLKKVVDKMISRGLRIGVAYFQSSTKRFSHKKLIFLKLQQFFHWKDLWQ